MYKVRVDNTGANWLDFPNVGFNGKWIVVTGNWFGVSSGSFTGSVAYVFNKASAMAGTGATYTKINMPTTFSSSGGFSVAPASTYDANESSLFLIDDYDGANGQLRLRKITGNVGSEVLSGDIGYPTSTTHWTTGPGDFMPQLGSPKKMDGGDNRTTNLIYRRGQLFCAHNVFLPASGATRESVMWWQIDTNGHPIQNGMIDDQIGPKFFGYPSIAVNRSCDILIGFSYLSSSIHPSAAYVMRLHSDPIDSMRPMYVYRHGQNTYFQNFGSGKNRWGDYSGSSVDVINDNDFWTVQESVPTTADLWDTWWAHITMCPAISEFTLDNDSANTASTITATFSGVAPSGATYSWSFDGGTATPGTGAGPHTVKWSSSGWKHITLTLTSGGCSTIWTDSVFVRPNNAVANVNNTPGTIRIQPNPSNGTFDILFEKPVTGAVLVKLTSVDGRVAFEHEFTTVSDNKLPIQTQALPAGVYFANIYSGDDIITQKVTITQ
jgi:hypothetical protein